MKNYYSYVHVKLFYTDKSQNDMHTLLIFKIYVINVVMMLFLSPSEPVVVVYKNLFNEIKTHGIYRNRLTNHCSIAQLAALCTTEILREPQWHSLEISTIFFWGVIMSGIIEEYLKYCLLLNKK